MPESPEKEPDASPLGKVLAILADIEHVIRYLLSGAAIMAVWLASRHDSVEMIEHANKHPSVTATVTIAVGFGSYTIYRLLWWTVGDRLAYLFGWSAFRPTDFPKGEAAATSCKLIPTPAKPSAFRRWLCESFEWSPVSQVVELPGSATSEIDLRLNNLPDCYAAFLVWRHSGAIPKSMSDYLFYRWAVAHFALVFSISLGIAQLNAEPGSYLTGRWPWTSFIVAVCGLAGLSQCKLLYQTERQLRWRQQSPIEGGDSAAAGSVTLKMQVTKLESE